MNKHPVSRNCPIKLVCNCLHDSQCVGQQARCNSDGNVPFSHFIAHVESKSRAAIIETWLAAAAGITLCSAMIGFVATMPT